MSTDLNKEPNEVSLADARPVTPNREVESDHITSNELVEKNQRGTVTKDETVAQPPFNKYFSNTSSLVGSKYLGSEPSTPSKTKKHNYGTRKSHSSRQSSVVRPSLAKQSPDAYDQDGHVSFRPRQDQKQSKRKKRPVSYDAQNINVKGLAESIEQQGVRDIQDLLEDEQIKTGSLSRRLKEREDELKDVKLELAMMKLCTETTLRLKDNREIQESNAIFSEENSKAEGDKSGSGEDSQTMTEKLETAQEAHREAEQKLQKVQEDLEAQRSKAEVLQQEKEELQALLAPLQRQFDEASHRQRDLENQISPNVPITYDNLAPTTQITDPGKADGNSWLQDKLEDLRCQINSRRQEVQQKSNKIQRLVEELENCQTRITELEKDKNEWRRTFEKLNRSLKRLAQPRIDKTHHSPSTRDGTFDASSARVKVEIAQSIRPHDVLGAKARDAEDVDYEHAVTILLLAARISLTCTHDYDKSLTLCDKASSVARRSRRCVGLQARCAYWKGRAQLELQLYPESIASLKAAAAHLSEPENREARELLAKARGLMVSANELPQDQQPED